jgi:succinyl-CoA synthetase alpha subunit
MFPFEVQFGHAGALARGNMETSDAKNTALAAAGAVVPSSFDAIDSTILNTYNEVC